MQEKKKNQGYNAGALPRSLKPATLEKGEGEKAAGILNQPESPWPLSMATPSSLPGHASSPDRGARPCPLPGPQACSGTRLGPCYLHCCWKEKETQFRITSFKIRIYLHEIMIDYSMNIANNKTKRVIKNLCTGKCRTGLFTLASVFILQAHIKFPIDYPYSPPTFRFLTKMWHPNIYEMTHKVESCPPRGGTLPKMTILLSVISLLNEPNTFSPANVDASVMFRKWRDSKGKDKEYAEIIRKQVLATKAEAEKDGVKVPTTLAEYCIKTKVPSNDNSSDLLYDD
ncbi:hypothetical protein IHE44_0004848, partial [Lamprotornis superbus]